MMKKLYVALVALLLVPLACIVDFPVEEPEKFECSSNDDCISGFECSNNRCISAGGPARCDDADGDGYGVGDTSECPSCTGSASDCREDCDDSDDSIHPGAPDVCDGKDNDCNPDTADGEIPCDSSEPGSSQCPAPEGRTDTLGECPMGSDTCQYFPALRFGAECNEPLACNGGQLDPVPDACK